MGSGGTLIALNVGPDHPRANCKCVRDDSVVLSRFAGIGAFARGPSLRLTGMFVRDNRFF